MIKKIIITFLIFILVIFVNINYIKSFYFSFLWKYYFNQDNIEKSKLYFTKADNEVSLYNLWNIYYKSWDYDLSIKNYESVLNTNSNELLFKVNHNLWNSYFRMWEIDSQNALDYFSISALYYNDALKIYFNEETKKNFEFVLEKIKLLEEKKSNKNTGDSNSSNNNNQSNESDDSSDDSGDSKWNWENSNKSETWLSQEQKEIIKEYQELLKKEEYQNSDSYNKMYEWAGDYSISENIYDNSLLEDKAQKDW